MGADRRTGGKIGISVDATDGTVNAQGGKYGYPLQAAHAGHEKAVQILLDAGAYVNTR